MITADPVPNPAAGFPDVSEDRPRDAAAHAPKAPTRRTARGHTRADPIGYTERDNLLPMDVLMERNGAGHLACTLVDRDATAVVAAADLTGAAEDLEAALADARELGYGECVWQLTDGDFKWLFRRESGRTDVVVLWSAGVVTGWQHVFRSETDAAELDRRINEELARVRREIR